MPSTERIKERYFKELDRLCQAGLEKRSTFAQRKKAVNYFVEFMNTENIELNRLNSQHIRDFLEFLSQKRTYQDKNLAPATIKQIYALAKSFYVRHYEIMPKLQHPDRVFTKNLLRRYKLGERKLPKYIDQVRMRRLLDECPDRWKALLHFMYDTGSRISEVLNVQTAHLDLDRKLVRIHEPKTMNVRVTSLSDTTVQLLKKYFSKYRPPPRAGYKSFVFINQQRRKMSPRAVQYIVRKISIEILGQENSITPHYFRAACAVHLLEGGVDIRQVQEIIGWKSLGVVQNYTRVTPQLQSQLKEQHHPGFQSKERERKIYQEESTSIVAQIESLRNQIALQQSGYQKEIEKLNYGLQQERLERMEERKAYEQRIDELIKSYQQIIQMMAQKSVS